MMKRVKLLSDAPLSPDGVWREVGAIVEVPAGEALALIRRGSAVLVGEDEPLTPLPVPPKVVVEDPIPAELEVASPLAGDVDTAEE